MVYVNAILVLAAVRQLCNSCATVVQQLCNSCATLVFLFVLLLLTSVAQHLTCATPGLEQVLCMFNTSRALHNVERATLHASPTAKERNQAHPLGKINKERYLKTPRRAAESTNLLSASSKTKRWLPSRRGELHQLRPAEVSWFHEPAVVRPRAAPTLK